MQLLEIQSFLGQKGKLPTPDRFKDSKPELLFVTDMESTVIPLDTEKKFLVEGETLSNNIKAMRALHSQTLKVLSTGSDIKRVRDFRTTLSQMGFDLTFNHNGKALYLGEDIFQGNSEIEPNEIQLWKSVVEDYAGWDNKALFEVTMNILKELGFTEIEHHYKSIYKNNVFMGNESGFALAVNPTTGSIFPFKNPDIADKELKRFIQILAERITTLYKNKVEKELTFTISEFEHYFDIFFEPTLMPINKLTSTQAIPYLFEPSFLEELKACIVAGDSENDQHLKLEVMEVYDKVIPVFSLHSGERLRDNPDFNGHGRIFSSKESANISEQLEKILTAINS